MSGQHATGFTCEECAGVAFLEGPHGSLSVNFCCARCWARYNDPQVFPIERYGFVAIGERDLFSGSYRPVGLAKKAGDE